MKKRNKRSTLRFLSVLLSLCLLLAMTPAVSAQTNETTTPETTTSSSGYTMEDLLAGLITPYELFEKPDPSVIPDAVGTDQAYARAHIERMYSEENGLDTVIFKNPDQSRTVYLFDYPVKYRDAHGITKDISLTVQNHPTQTGAYQSAPGTVQTNFSKNVTDGIALQHEEISVKLIPVLPTPELQPGETMQMTANAVAQLKDSKTVSYAYDAKTTIEYSPTYTGFKEDIVVQEYTGQTEYHFLLQTNGLTLQKINESYFLTDSEGNIKATLGDIIIFTADEKNNTMGSMTHETLRENQLYGLTIHVDAEYLQDENTAYPIRIDPTLEINYDNNGTGAIEDATLNSDGVTTGGSGSIYVGNRSSYGLARVLMKFPALNLSSIASADQITSAVVQIRDMLCQAAEMQVNCHVFTGPVWSESSVNWTSAGSNSYVGTFLSSQAVSYANGAAKSNPHRYAFDITAAAKGWFVGNYDQGKGIIFKATSSVENGSTYISKTFASYNRASYKPFLTLTYSDPSYQLVANGTYSLNNESTGKYLHNATTDANAVSGTIDSLGNTIRWNIQKYDSYNYIISSVSNPNQYLGVSDSLSLDEMEVELVTVSQSAIPQRCLWSIGYSATNDLMIHSAFNGYYLWNTNSLVNISGLVVDSASDEYDRIVWRIASTSYIAEKELWSSTEFHNKYLVPGGFTQAAYRKEPALALWADLYEFNYSISNSPSHVSLSINSSGYIQASALTSNPGSEITQEVIWVNVTHRTTGHSFDFNITIYYNLPYMGELHTWENDENELIGRWSNNYGDAVTLSVYSEFCGNAQDATYALNKEKFNNSVQHAKDTWAEELGINFVTTSNPVTANIAIYGGNRDRLLDKFPTLTTSEPGKTIKTEIPIGYYEMGQQTKILKRILHVEMALVSSGSQEEQKNTAVHEMGHALGFNGHSEDTEHVMYPKVIHNSSPVLTPSYDEILHLAQVYGVLI